MNNSDAKRILMLYRPDLDDNTDPHIREALDLVERDPELARWHRHHLATDRAVSDSLDEIDPPVDLGKTIITEHRQQSPGMRWVFNWPMPAVLATASVALVVLILWFIQPWESELNHYRNAMVKIATADMERNITATTLSQLRQEFLASGWPADYVVPVSLKSMEVDGGLTLKWKNEKVSVLCLEDANELYIWMFVINRKISADNALEHDPQIMQIRKLATAIWQADNMTYLITTDKEIDFLQKHH